MERPKYIVIQDWMVEDYHLSGTELIVFALVYGFSQDGTSDFRGSASYVGACCGCTERTARNILHMLEEKGFVVSTKCVQNSQVYTAYRAVETEKISEHGKNFRARKKFPSTEKISEGTFENPTQNGVESRFQKGGTEKISEHGKNFRARKKFPSTEKISEGTFENPTQNGVESRFQKGGTEKISEHGKNFRANSLKNYEKTEEIFECEKNSTNDTSIKNISSNNIDSSSILSCIKDKEIKERNPKKENKEKEKETNYDFVEEKFSIPFYRWLAYKRSIGSTYKNKTSLKAAYNRMLKLADYSPAKAEEIVEFSIANNYIGLFAPKDNFNKTNKSDKLFTYGNIQAASGDEAKYHSTI